jgi:hypothetical protein
MWVRPRSIARRGRRLGGSLPSFYFFARSQGKSLSVTSRQIPLWTQTGFSVTSHLDAWRLDLATLFRHHRSKYCPSRSNIIVTDG